MAPLVPYHNFFKVRRQLLFRFWNLANLEQSSAEKAGIQRTYQGIQPTSPLPTPLPWRGAKFRVSVLAIRLRPTGGATAGYFPQASSH